VKRTSLLDYAFLLAILSIFKCVYYIALNTVSAYGFSPNHNA